VESAGCPKASGPRPEQPGAVSPTTLAQLGQRTEEERRPQFRRPVPKFPGPNQAPGGNSQVRNRSANRARVHQRRGGRRACRSRRKRISTHLAQISHLLVTQMPGAWPTRSSSFRQQAGQPAPRRSAPGAEPRPRHRPAAAAVRFQRPPRQRTVPARRPGPAPAGHHPAAAPATQQGPPSAGRPAGGPGKQSGVGQGRSNDRHEVLDPITAVTLRVTPALRARRLAGFLRPPGHRSVF